MENKTQSIIPYKEDKKAQEHHRVAISIFIFIIFGQPQIVSDSFKKFINILS